MLTSPEALLRPPPRPVRRSATPQDLFSLLGRQRPPHRWLVLGPARAGASWHVDPSLTSAWNALLSGAAASAWPYVRP